MPVLESQLNPRSAEFQANAAAMQALVDDLKVAGGQARRRRRRNRAGQAHGARQAVAARSRADPAGPRHAVPGAGADGRPRPVQRRRALRRHHRRHRPRQRGRLHDRVQRRHGEGRHLLPDHGEEAPAGAGDRAAEPPALHLPGRLRRRQPADPGRRVPGSRALRPHLLQPGQPERAGHRPDRGGDGFVHGRRRLHAGDERRDHHRQEPGHDFPGRAAAGEGGHRRDRVGRRPGRRRRAHAAVGRGRSPGAERHARAGAGAAGRGHAESRPSASSSSCASRARPSTIRKELYGVVPNDMRKPYDVREIIARIVDASEFHEFKAALRHHAGLRLRAHRRHAGRHHRQQRHPVFRDRRRSARTSSSCAASARCRWCSCRTSPASWSAASTRTRASPGTAPRW